MQVSVVTLFPAFFQSALEVGVVSKAQETGALQVELIDLRQFGEGRHRQVDDAPFGGGAGMVLMPGPLAEAVAGLENSHRVFLTPAGRPLQQDILASWSRLDHLTLVCGRYEGVDERFVEEFIDEEISLGDFVLAGGEAAALAIIEGVARLLPGVLGNPQSAVTESFRQGLLEEPQYTRPANFAGRSVPSVLLSGDHGRIAAWRQEQRQVRTSLRRPDLLSPTDEEQTGAEPDSD